MLHRLIQRHHDSHLMALGGECLWQGSNHIAESSGASERGHF
jgi:hypothetical protein